MASINLAEKYATKVAERFSLTSLTDAFAGKDYDFSGVQSIQVYSIDTVSMNDYDRTLSENRFGSLAELGDTVQELKMTRDRSFTFSIDKGNNIQQFNVKQATQCLKRQIDEVVTPEVDEYRLAAWAAGAGLTTATTITKSNVIETIMNGGMALNNNKAPRAKRALFIKESIYVHAKLADQVVGIEKLGQKAVKDGSVGTLDGMKVVPVPDSYFPDGVNFIIKCNGVTVDPVQLKTYRVLTEQRGIDGDVVEGRIIYDSFVLDSKKNGIFVSTAS